MQICELFVRWFLDALQDQRLKCQRSTPVARDLQGKNLTKQRAKELRMLSNDLGEVVRHIPSNPSIDPKAVEGCFYGIRCLPALSRHTFSPGCQFVCQG